MPERVIAVQIIQNDFSFARFIDPLRIISIKSLSIVILYIANITNALAQKVHYTECHKTEADIMDIDREKAPMTEVGEANFEPEVLKSKLPVLVAFWAPWSRPCQILRRALAEVAVKCAGSAKVVRVNADDNPELSMWYDVQSIPTLLFFVDGLPRATVVGTASGEAIVARLQAVCRAGDIQKPSYTANHEHERPDL